MDLTGIVSGQRVVSRRRLIQGFVAGVGGSTAAAVGGYQLLSSTKDDQNDDDIEATAPTESASGSRASRDPDTEPGHSKSVVSQIDLTERDGRVTIRLGVYERVVADFNRDGEAVGESAWRVDGSLAARSGVSFRANEDNTVQLTLQNPTPIPYSLSIHSGNPPEGRLAVDSYGITVYGGGTETLQLADLRQGDYSYLVETPSRPIEPLTGRLLVDRDPSKAENTTDNRSENGR